MFCRGHWYVRRPDLDRCNREWATLRLRL